MRIKERISTDEVGTLEDVLPELRQLQKEEESHKWEDVYHFGITGNLWIQKRGNERRLFDKSQNTVIDKTWRKT